MPYTHPRWFASATAWRGPEGDVRARRGLLIQCPLTASDGHEHSDEVKLRSEWVTAADVGPAVLVTIQAADSDSAMDTAFSMALTLGALLPQGQGEGAA